MVEPPTNVLLRSSAMGGVAERHCNRVSGFWAADWSDYELGLCCKTIMQWRGRWLNWSGEQYEGQARVQSPKFNRLFTYIFPKSSVKDIQ
jgi:hypothetical protein